MSVCLQNVHGDVDADRYKQCIEYLSRYGSHYQHILFINRQRGLRDAITTFKQMVSSHAASYGIFYHLHVGKINRIIIGSDRQPETKQGIEGKIDRFRSGTVADPEGGMRGMHPPTGTSVAYFT